ncbi:hypothetical protein [Desulfovibrio litoralis]|uniref:Uncharacterized protein n=1 Tax=Desulfovibrio litoralis DSM 11393 TaxID=1121455 RepID=A0A1M7S7F8_9BACT|nr:hypothetical protein [Desulfovibrio litoralis]SHN54305.1 hypothetical protein SAMN02745728_00519 [Desulfovibrio litoralis DSM 11393]
MRRFIKFFVLSLLINLIITTQAFAFDPYFGFRPGQQNFEEIRKDLRERGATFSDNISYQDYNTLRSIQILRHAKFSLEGSLRFATLDFDPNGYLYKVTISWKDDGTLFKKWKEILNTTPYFDIQDCKTQGFADQCFWQNKQTDFSLLNDPVGFGENRNTTLTFTYSPALIIVDKERKRIDKEVEKAKIIEKFNRFKQ